MKNRNIHSCKVSEQDYKNVQAKIDMLSRLAEVENSVYSVYDMNKGNFLLQSDEQIKLLGAPDRKTKIDAELHYKNIHPEDLSFVIETDRLVYDFFAALHPDKKKDYKLVYDFRTKNAKGNYVRHMHQVIVLEQDKTGKSWLMLVISNLISERPANECPERRLFNMKTRKLHLFDNEGKWGVDPILTERECEVLTLISSGYDSINISDKLNISINTVNNHRQNILRKTRTDNTTQAVLYSKRLGII